MSQELQHTECLYLYDNLPGLLSMAWAIWQRFRGDVYRIQDELAVEHQAKGLAYRWSMPHRSFFTCTICGHQDTKVLHILQNAAGRRVELTEEAVHMAREHGIPFSAEVQSFLAELAGGEQGQSNSNSLEPKHTRLKSTGKASRPPTRRRATRKAISGTPELAAVRDRLIAILKPYEKGSLKPTVTEGWDYGLAAPATAHSVGRMVWFGGVNTNKRYVSYYLMPVYTFPDLLESISPQLRKRMQGKSCWNLRYSDDALFAELGVLTEKAYQRYIAEGWIVPGEA